MPMPDPEPLLVTLALDPAAFAFFDESRRRWFPADRNLVPAHLTLFHRLPGSELATLAPAAAQSARVPMRTPHLLYVLVTMRGL